MKRARKRRAQKSGRTNPKKKRVSTSKVFVATLAMLAVGGGGYLLYNRLRRNPTMLSNEDGGTPIIINNNIPTASIAKTSSSSRNDSFPLKRGSRGARVTQLQQALANKIGSAAMTANGGIDGQFGPGTANALKTAGYGEVIDEATLNRIVGTMAVAASSALEPATHALTLYRAAQSRNLDNVLMALRALASTADYSAVNTYYRNIGLVEKTIVTDLLEIAFQGNEQAREAVKKEFLRMGLKVSDAGTWSLTGVPIYRDLITIRPTFVLDTNNNRVPVPTNMVLGDEVRVENGMTWVKGIDSRIFRVPTQDVMYTR